MDCIGTPFAERVFSDEVLPLCGNSIAGRIPRLLDMVGLQIHRRVTVHNLRTVFVRNVARNVLQSDSYYLSHTTVWLASGVPAS